MLYALLQQPSASLDPTQTLRHIYSGGDPLLPWAIEELVNRFPGVGLTQVYGLTEGTPITTCLDNDRTRPNSVGTPIADGGGSRHQ